jgi:hypothetical protein
MIFNVILNIVSIFIFIMIISVILNIVIIIKFEKNILLSLKKNHKFDLKVLKTIKT